MRLTVTGHRPPKLGGYSDRVFLSLTKFAQCILTNLVEDENITGVITGMALGWDQAVAQACIELELPFFAAIPCEDHESKWPEASRVKYHHILHKASGSKVLSSSYTRTCMQDRNIWMVDHADIVAALWDGSSGGTRNCVTYAKAKDVSVINLWDDWKEWNDE